MPFISFEGCDKSGKTTQAQILFERLEKLRVPTISIRSPGGVVRSTGIDHLPLVIGEDLRALSIKYYDTSAGPYLFMAGFVSMAPLIEWACEKDIFVIADRWVDSCCVYQGNVRPLLNLACLPMPTTTFLLIGQKGSFEEDDFHVQADVKNKEREDAFRRLSTIDPFRWIEVSNHEKTWNHVQQRYFPGGEKEKYVYP